MESSAAMGPGPHHNHPPAPAGKQAEGNYAVQLGAFRSGSAAANKHWERLQKEYPQLLAGLTPKVVPKKTAGGMLYQASYLGLAPRFGEVAQVVILPCLRMFARLARPHAKG